MIGRKAPIPDNILAHIRRCAQAEHPGAHMAPQWQLALDHRRWLLAEVDRLRAELDTAREEIEFLSQRATEH